MAHWTNSSVESSLTKSYKFINWSLSLKVKITWEKNTGFLCLVSPLDSPNQKCSFMALKLLFYCGITVFCSVRLFGFFWLFFCFVLFLFFVCLFVWLFFYPQVHGANFKFSASHHNKENKRKQLKPPTNTKSNMWSIMIL